MLYYITAGLLFIVSIACMIAAFIDDDVFGSRMPWYIVGWLITFLASGAFFITGAAIDDNEYRQGITTDCNRQNGQILHTGKYGSDVCIVDGKIVKVYE